MYICHVSSPLTVKLVEDARRNGGVDFEIILEVTWHHLLLNVTDYAEHQHRVKMNPPLRAKSSQQELFNMLLEDRLDIIATDHAPHPLDRKDDFESPASGIPAIPFWPKGIAILRKHRVSDERIAWWTFHNANHLFDLDCEEQEFDARYDPGLWEKYGYNPFARVDGFA
jgi:dihydroorotase